jgi:hypothetical protein
MAEEYSETTPFYEDRTSPPPALPLLTAQTDPLYFFPPRMKLLVQDDFAAIPSRHNKRFSPYVKLGVRFSNIEGSRETLYSQRSVGESSSDLEKEGKIPKPFGEVGRPGRGGYNLEEILRWKPKNFEKLKVHFSINVVISN